MPASLSEAFKSPNNDTSSYTRTSLESLKNPLYGSSGSTTDTNTNNFMYNSLGQPFVQGFNYGATTLVGSSLGSSHSPGSSPMSNPGSSPNPGSGFGRQYQIQNTNLLGYGNSYSNQLGGVNTMGNTMNVSQPADTASLISSINSDKYNDEIEEIRKKYNMNGIDDTKRPSSKNCDMHIYHILSCSKCRKRLKKILLGNSEQNYKKIRNNRGGRESEDEDDVLADDGENVEGEESEGEEDDEENGTRANGTRARTSNTNKSKKPKKKSNGLFDINTLFRKDNQQTIFLYIVAGIFILMILDFIMRFRR